MLHSSSQKFLRLLIVVCISSCFFIFPSTANASILIVNTLIDENDGSCTDGDCSLRDAIQVASAGDEIYFNVTGTIILTLGHVVLNKDLVISGPGPNRLILSGNYTSRIFYNESNVSLSGLTITKGRDNEGGGIYNDGDGVIKLDDIIFSDNATTQSENDGGGLRNNGRATLSNVAFVNNSSVGGGGMGNWGTAELINVTFSGNSSDWGVGALWNWGYLTLTNVTITENINGGLDGAYNVNIKNSIIAGNTNYDCSGTINSYGNNLIENIADCTITGDQTGNIYGQDPLLGPLQNNGGDTLTHALLDGSPAIDAADITDANGNPVIEDQRGVSRPQGPANDMGAYEKKEIAGIDLLIDDISPVQSIEGGDLVKGKSTAIKVIIRKNGSESANNVSVKITNNGLAITNFYVYDPANLDPIFYHLEHDNTIFPLNFSSSDSTKIIYFFSNDLKPNSSPYQVEVTVDNTGQIPETNELNNSLYSDSLPVYDVPYGLLFPDWRIKYFRMDWGMTNPGIFDSFYYVSTIFVGGVYPVADNRYLPEKASRMFEIPSIYRGLDGKLSGFELGVWLSELSKELVIANPQMDRAVASVPPNWFRNFTTIDDAVGVYYPLLPVVVSEAINANYTGPSIAAHELGHSYGFGLFCEEYDECNLSRQGGIGNYANSGLLVSQKEPILDRTVYCFMGSYDPSKEYWVEAVHYDALMWHQSNNLLNQKSNLNNKAILAVGAFDITGTVLLDDWYIVDNAELSTVSPGPYSFEYQDSSGNILGVQSIDVPFSTEGTTLDHSPFVITIPYIENTAKIIIKYNNAEIGQKTISQNAPFVNLITPSSGKTYGDFVPISWQGIDLDDDQLAYVLLFSQDDGINWEPIVGNLSGNNYLWDLTTVEPGTQYKIKIVATDGINTDYDITEGSFTIIEPLYQFLPVITR